MIFSNSSHIAHAQKEKRRGKVEKKLLASWVCADCLMGSILSMADDDMAVLLQEAIAELQASRKQTEVLVKQNNQLMNQNSSLTEKVKEMLDSRIPSRRQPKPRVEVSVHTKVICTVAS